MVTRMSGSFWKRSRRVERKFLLVLLVAFVPAGLGLAQQASPSIVPDGNTQTSLSTSGNVTNVTTSTTSGDNAYNSFSIFNVNQNDVVNLFLPGGTDNLLNLVNSQAMNVDGILNSIKDGKIGGNVFFADPYGVFVGHTGVVNVGSFTALTPTENFMNQFFTSPGNPSPTATTAILNGTVPISSDGLISVKGTINAIGNIGLYGGAVTNAGTIQSGAVFSGSSPDFSDVVNTNGLQNGTSIAVRNGNIVIQAAGDFENLGSIATNGASNLNGGDINIQAGGNVKLGSGSLISASGSGQDSNGGDISIMGGGNGELLSGAVVAATGGDVSGNGGTIDFSAQGTLNLDGGLLKAGAVNGIAGTVTLDPTDLTISANEEPNDGTNLDFSADDSITVDPGVTISSRQIGAGSDALNGSSTGDSGDISFEAPQITVGDGAEILANATGSYNAGDISMTAESSDEGSAAEADAGISIGNATLSAGNISLTATSDAKADNAVDSFVQTTLDDLNLGFAVTGPAAADTASATSKITIGDPSSTGLATLNASEDVSIDSEANSDVKADIVGAPQGVAYGQSNASATATIGSNATITAGGSFDLSATTNDNLELLSQTGGTTPLNVAVSFGEANSVSNAEVAGQVTAGDINVETENDNKFATEAKGFNNTGGGSAAGGIGVALGFYQSSANTSVPGSLTATDGDVNISSSSTNDENATRSESEVTDKTDLGKIENQTVPFLGTLSGFIKSHSKTKTESNSNQFGLAAAVSYMSSSNKASSNVSGSVTADSGAVSIDGKAEDDPKISAAGSSDGANLSVGGGVAIGNFTNEADATVTGSADITAADDVAVDADAEIPNPVSTGFDELAKGFDFTGVDFSNPIVNSSGTGWGQNLWNDIQTLYSGVKGVQKDVINPGEFFTSFTNTGLSAEGSGTAGLAGSVDLTSVTNQSDADIAGTAQVTSNTGDVEVNASSDATIINVAGMAFSLDSVLDLNPGVSGGSSLGGSYAGITLNNSSTAYIGDNTKVAATDGSVDVGSDTKSFALDVVQSGDKAEKFGVTGAFDFLNLNDASKAYIQSDATVTAGKDVNVNATNKLNDFVVDGALGMGGTVQVGVTVGWNQINQTTLAYIGDPSNLRTSICAGCGVTAHGDVNVNANSRENVYAISLAATKSGSSGEGADGESSSEPEGEVAPSNSGESSAGGETTTVSGEEGAGGEGGGGEEKGGTAEEGDNGAGGGEYGFGISGNIAFNQINDGSGGPGVTTEAFINNGANVNATGDINLNASDNSFVVAAGVAATLGQTLSLAGAYSQNSFIKQVEAYTENSTLSGKGLSANADDQGDLFDISAGGGLNTEEGIAIAGSVNNNSINNTTEAYLGAGTTATGIGSDGITLGAKEGLGSGGDIIVSVAGGFGIGLDGGGVGAGVDLGNYKNTVTASVESGADVGSAGNAEITADTNQLLVPVAVSLAGGDEFGAAGSFAYEQLTNNTTASVDGTLSTDANLLIGSNDTSNVIIVGGGVGLGGDAGFGVTGVIPAIDRTTTASIGDNANVTALGSDSSPLTYDNQNIVGTLLDATASGSLSDFAIAAGGSEVAGVAGAVIINPFFRTGNTNTLNDDTEATIGSGATVNGDNTSAASDQSVMLEAKDSTGILDVAGALGVGGEGGVGVGFDMVTPVWTVKTGIGAGATVNAADNVVTSSVLDNSLKSIALALAASVNVEDEVPVSASGAGAASNIEVTTNTDAYINGKVNAGGSVEVAADRNTGSLTTVDGDAAVAVSLGAGLGVSFSRITTNDTVDASIGGTGDVTALGNDLLEAPNGQLDSSGNPEASPFQGVSVTAMSHSSVNAIAAGVAGSGAVGGQGSVPINNLTETTSAHIDSGAQVNVNDDSNPDSSQSVQALATDQTDLTSVAAGGALGFVGLAAGVDTDTVNRTVQAYISGATVNAADNVLVDASMLGSINSSAAAGSAGGISIAGAVSTINETTDTEAYIDGGADVTANGSVGILANRNTKLNTQDGAVAVGGQSANGSVSTVNKSDTVSAYVGSNTSVTALGQGAGLNVPVDSSGNLDAATVNGLSVAATSKETIQTIAVGAAVAAGVVGVAASGSVTANNITENTSAKIESGATINGNNANAASDQSVNVLASDDTKLTNVAGAAGAVMTVGAGIGAGVDVGNIQKTTVAGIDNGADVSALGAVNVDALSSETIDSYVAAAGGALGVGLAGTTADYSTKPIKTTTTAYVGSCTTSTDCDGGATVNAGSVGVDANDDLGFKTISGIISAGGVALGAGTFEVTADGNTSAFIGALSNVTASSGGIGVTSEFTDNLSGQALAGSGAAVSGNAAWGSVTDNSNNSAYIADGAKATSKGDLDVEATTNRTDSGKSSGLSVGIAAAGASLATVNVNGTTEAYIGDATATSKAGGINVIANLTDNSTATSNGIGGGVASGVGTHPKVTDNANTDAYATGGAVLSSPGTTTIQAQANRTATANSGAKSFGGVAVGESLAAVSIGGQTEAYLDSGAQVGSEAAPSGGLSVLASDTDKGDATATPTAGGVGAGIGGKTTDDISPTVSASDNGATVNVSGAMDVHASDSSTVDSMVKGVQLGAVTGGSVNAEGSAKPTISASVNGGTANAGSIAIEASGNQSMTVNGTSSASSSFVSGMSISATGTLSPTISASVSGGAILTATNNIQVGTNSTNFLGGSVPVCIMGSCVNWPVPGVYADGSAGSFNVGSGGSANATARINNNNSVTIGSATLTSSKGNLDVQADSNNSTLLPSAYTYTGSGFVQVGGATTKTFLTDTTTTTLQDGSDLEALSGNLSVGATGSESASSSANNPNGLSAAAQSNAEADTTVNATVTTDVESGATVRGKTTTISALLPLLYASASSNATCSAIAGCGSYATSKLNATGTPTVEVGGTVEGTDSLTLNAEVGAPDGSGVSLTSSAYTDAKAGIVPISHAYSTNNSTLTSLVQADKGSALVTNNLDVNSLVPSTSVYSNSAHAPYTFYGLLGIPIHGTGTEHTYGSANFNNTITLNTLLKQPTSELADLTINPDGTYSGSFGVQGEDGSNIVLQPLAGNQLVPPITLNAPGGTVQGNITVDPSAKIVNNSDLNLVLQGITTASGNSAPDITINAAHNDISATSNPLDSVPITIENNTGSDVIFAGDIYDPTGILTVTNKGGDILTLGGVQFTLNSIYFGAPLGAIGISGQIPCSGEGCPTTAVDGEMLLGPFDVNLAPLPMTINGEATEWPGQVSAVAGGNIDMNLTRVDAHGAAPGSGSSVPVDLTNIAAGADANLYVAGAPLDLYGLFEAGGSANISDTGGGIYVGGDGQLVQANSINLSALDGQIGTGSDPVNIALTGGAVSASAQGDVYLFAPSGDMPVGTIDSALGNVELNTADGSILNGNSSGGVNVTGNNVTLTSAGSIGASGNRLVVDNRNSDKITNGTPDGSNYLDMSAQGDIDVEERGGNLLSHSVSSAAGNIDLLASDGNGYLDQVIGNQNVTANVAGSLLDINDITGSAATTQKMASPDSVSLTVGTAGGTLNVSHMDVYQSVTTRADNTYLPDVVHTNLANPQLDTEVQADGLHFDDRGAAGGTANNIDINVTPCAQCATALPVIFDHYWTQTGDVSASVDWLEFINAIVGTGADFRNNWLDIQLTNKYAGKSSGKAGKADTPWYLFMIGNHTAQSYHPIEFDHSKFLQKGVQPVYPKPIGKLFNDLLTSYGLRP